jgi:hypothetical protein
LSNIALEASFDKEEKLDVGVILEALWHSAHGQLPPKSLLLDVDFVPPLDSPPSSDVVEAARQSFHDIVEESQLNEDLFEKLLLFQIQAISSRGFLSTAVRLRSIPTMTLLESQKIYTRTFIKSRVEDNIFLSDRGCLTTHSNRPPDSIPLKMLSYFEQSRHAYSFSESTLCS